MAAPASKRRPRAAPALVASPREQASRERIQQAALRLFALRGYEAASLQMIADEVGLHKSTLFHHYGSKLEIVDDVLTGIIEHILGWVGAVKAQDPPELGAFLSAIDELVDYFADRPEAARLLVVCMTAPRDSELSRAGSAERVIEFYAGLSTWLDRARKTGAIAKVSIRQTIPNLMGLMLMYPATAMDLAALVGEEPFSARARQVRKRELAALLRGLLEPK